MPATTRALLVAVVLALARPALAGALGRAQVAVTPVQKVINMLNDMLAKGKKEKEDEQVLFKTYQQFCTSTRAEKEAAIKAENEMIEKLTADIAKYASEILATQEAIAVHDKDIAEWQAEKDKSTAARNQEKADFDVEYNDYTMSIDSVLRAKASITAGSSASLLQVRGAIGRVAQLQMADAGARQALEAFLQAGKSDLDLGLLESGAPEAKQYESHSGGVLDIVEQMGDNFEDKRTEIEKEEMTKKFAFDQIMQGLTSSLNGATSEREEKVGRVQELEQQKSQAEGDLGQTKTDLAADTAFLKSLNIEAHTKAEDYEKRQGLRAGEIEALSQAIEIMSGAAVAAGSAHLPTLAQTSLVQLRSSNLSPLQKNAAAFLAERARATNSRLLTVIAEHVKADPFKKVTKMIKDMVEKLMTEANEDAGHKGFCDTEMGTNKNTRDMKSQQVEELTARSEELTADIKKLAELISVLGNEIAAIDAEVIKATAERTAEKEKNTATIADAKGGQQATIMAIDTLKRFYDKAAEATALAQLDTGAQVPGAPATFDKPYTGMGSANGGVIGMLEVIESDFSRLDAETTAGEAIADKDFQRFTTKASKDKDVKTTDMNAKSREKTQFESELNEAKKDLKSTKEELSAAMLYFDKLKPSCVEEGVSYADRVAARKAEIESLKEALQILNETAP